MNTDFRQTCLDALLNHTTDNIYFKDSESRFLLVSRSMAKWCGLADPSEFVGKTDADLFASEHAEQALADERALILGGKDRIVTEEKETWPDGRVTWVSTVKMPLHDAQGAIIGTFGISRDITDRVRAEQELLATDRRLRALEAIVNQISAVVFRWGPTEDWPVLYVTDNVRIFGYEPADLIGSGRTYSDLVHPDDLAGVRRSMENFLAEKRSTYTVDYRLLRKDGAIRWVEERGLIHRGEDGRVLDYQGIVLDVTDRHEAEAELEEYRSRLEQMVRERTADLQVANERLEAENARRRATEEAVTESERRYRGLLESVTDYVYTVELRDGRPASTHHGPGCEAVTGFTSSEYDANPYLWFDMVLKEDRERVLNQASLLSAGQEVRPLEHRIRRKDGAIRWVRSTVVPRRNAEGTLTGYDGLVKDITERREAEEARLKAERMALEAREHETMERADRLSSLGVLASGVAHEVNNPLQGMLSHLDAVRRALPAGFPKLRSLEMVESGIETIASLVQRLLWMGATPDAADETCNFAEAVSFVTDLMTAEFQKSGVRIAVKARSLHVRLAIPHRELVQILMNLLMNARDAMPKGGTITLSCDCAGSEAAIAIADTGSGIPKDILPKIFSPFFTTKGTKGTGLGLSVAESLVRGRKGRIAVESAVGSGSTFTMWLPRAEGKTA